MRCACLALTFPVISPALTRATPGPTRGNALPRHVHEMLNPELELEARTRASARCGGSLLPLGMGGS